MNMNKVAGADRIMNVTVADAALNSN